MDSMRKMGMTLFFFLLPPLMFACVGAQMLGFTSINCGGAESYTDEIGLEWVSDDDMIFGQTANISVPGETRKQYSTLRYFPPDKRKYCYTLNVTSRTRYLVRATFLYGNFDKSNVYPKFDISLGPTHWWTVVIDDENRIVVQEMILLAQSPSISVCLSSARTGQPFISTLELRQFNNAMYLSDHELNFYLFVSARINFGALSDEPIRYPDDPFDRIWVSDTLKMENYLVDVAAGTTNISTFNQVDVAFDDRPPVKVMQTAVVGNKGSLNYRINLDGFPGNGWAFCYFAEIEHLRKYETRKFSLSLPGHPEINEAVVNIAENAHGRFRLYEPGFINISLPYLLEFSFQRTNGSTRGPLLNALEINKHLQINYGSQYASLMASLVSHYPQSVWAKEGGDPCVPVPWSWVQCNSDPQPKVVSVLLSAMNLTGNIPLELTQLSGLTELWLDRNSLVGSIPDFSGCTSLQRLHLENNQLTGVVPSSLWSFQNLIELHVENNLLSGGMPCELLKKNMHINFSGNVRLHCQKETISIKVLFISVGAFIILLFVVASIFCCISRCLNPKRSSKDGVQKGELLSQSPVSLSNTVTECTRHFGLSELEYATERFSKQVGSGGFGVVYYGKLMDGKEIAVKVLSTDSFRGTHEFQNEVSLLSRIHHRNLVRFLGFCKEGGTNILVYEFMHNGALKECLYGSNNLNRLVSWIKRLEIAEDAAKGLEYLHTGCVPAVIHRDIKSSNILLDKRLRAKVSDFGLSKVAVEGSTKVSSMVGGTFGYLDPEYYVTLQLTDKSDVYSFGIILFELISGREAISNESSEVNARNIVMWAKSHVESGDIRAIIDPSLQNNFDIQSVWKIAEKAMSCVQLQSSHRPSISEVIKEIQEAISIEKGSALKRDGNSDEFLFLKSSSPPPFSGGFEDFEELESYASFDNSLVKPTAR